MTEIDGAIIKSTQESLGKYVSKPPLTEKLLKKPPFRFLHDVINAVIRDTGFLKGLYTAAELNSENIKERDSKVAFLNKLITGVKAVTGVDLKVRASKVISGLEPEETNKLLQTIANAIDNKIDTTTYTTSLHNQEKTIKTKIPKSKDIEKFKKITSKTSVTSKESKESRSSLKAGNKNEPKDGKRDPKSKSRGIEKKSLEDGQKIVSNQKRKTNDSPKDLKSTSSKAIKDVTLDSADDKERIMKMSRQTLEKSSPVGEGTKSMDNVITPSNLKVDDEDIYVSPKVEEIQNELKMMMEENDKDEDMPKHLEVNVNVINKSVEEVKKLETKEIGKTEWVEPPKKMERPKSARPRSGDQKKENKIPEDIESTATDLDIKQTVQIMVEKKSNTAEPVTPVLAASHDPSSVQIQMPSPAPTVISPPRPQSSLRPPSARPSSARPAAPRLRPDSALPGKEIVTMGKIKVIVENYDYRGIDSAASGVESGNNIVTKSQHEDEEETVVINNIDEDIKNEVQPTLEETLEISGINKGHLVEQILEQIQEDQNAGLGKGSVLDWNQEGSRNRDATYKEINLLRNSIQALTRTANPLGKLMSYLHEDVEAMHTELTTWTNMKNQYISEIAKQKKLNEDSTAPLKQQLDEIQENIKKQKSEIALVKYNVIKNEEKIKDLILKQITVQ